MPLLHRPRPADRPAGRLRGFAPALAATLALGTALGGPVLSLAHGRLANPRTTQPAPVFDRPGPWTPEVRVPDTIQGDAIDALVGIALAVALLLVAGAAVNVATLLLSRAASRHHETAVRAVLGATPAALARRGLEEGALLGAIGGGAGLLLGAALYRVGRGSWPGGADLFAHVRPLDGLAATAAVLVALVLLAALLPAAVGARRNLYAALTVGARATGGPGEAMLRKALAVMQFAASATLLTGAVLLLRGSFPRAGAADPGFDPRDTLTFHVDLAAASPAKRAEVQRALLAAAVRLPGVRGAAAASPDAWLGTGTEDKLRSLCDACVWGNMYAPILAGRAHHHAVSPGWFRAMGMRVLQGRELRPDDDHAVLINRVFAATLLPRANPVGQQVLFKGFFEDPYRVVGVVDDARVTGPGSQGSPPPTIYLSSFASPPRALSLAIRTVGAPQQREAAIRRALATAAPGARVAPGVAMDAVLERHRAPLRWFAVLLAVLAAGATLASAGGLYGVMSFSVARRTREIGVRMAVGASERAVLREVLAEGVRVALLGTVVGSVGAASLARVLQVTFYGVDPFDAGAYLGVAAVLAAVTLAASYFPARRAARVDPNVALRAE